MTNATTPSTTAQRTNATIKAESEEIRVGRADKMAGMLPDDAPDVETVRDGLQEMFKDQIDVYISINLTKVKDGDPVADHLYYTLVNYRTEEIIQSSDPHALFRLTSENSNHEDKATGSKHELAVAHHLDGTFGTPDRTHI